MEEMKLQKILVVEDNEDNREILVFRLKMLGTYEILTASHGEEALDVAFHSRPDIIIMDLMMPVMSGWEAIKALREVEWGKNTPVIALTAHALEDKIEQALTDGFDDYVVKPITDYTDLYRKIQRLLESSVE